MARKLVTQRFPFLVPVRLAQRRLFRRIRMLFDRTPYAASSSRKLLEFTAAEHRLPLIRRMAGVDMQLQHNKLTNLRLAARRLDGLLIRPGETFSFWRTVGRPSAKKGYLPGLCLRNGELSSGTGGGLCQMGNLLFWMFLHSPMDIVERSHHSFDYFPDDHRVIPFGTGVSLMYNFLDLRVINRTSTIYQLHIWFDSEFIHGRLLSDRESAFSYHLFERNQEFIRREDGIHRLNKVYRDTIDNSTGMVVTSELLMSNDGLVRYEVGEELLTPPASPPDAGKVLGRHL